MASINSRNSKERSTNFIDDETNKLACLLKDFQIITSKKTYNASNQQKETAWRSLAEKFNADAAIYRSVKQLKQKFNNMKKMSRKEISAEKNSRRQIGGGPPPPKPSKATLWLNSIMGESQSGLPAVYDNDALDDTKNTSLSIVRITKAKSNISNVDIALEIMEEKQSQHDSNAESLLLKEDSSCTVTQGMDIPQTFTSEADMNFSERFEASTPKALLRKPISKQ